MFTFSPPKKFTFFFNIINLELIFAVHWLHLKTDYAPVGRVMVSLEIMERGTLEFALFLLLLPWEYIGAPCASDPFTFNSKLPPFPHSLLAAR